MTAVPPMSVTNHAIDSYARFYPQATGRDVLEAARRATKLQREVGNRLVGRRTDGGDGDLWLHAERTGLFVVCGGAIVTFLRFYSKHQHQLAVALHGPGAEVTAVARWADEPASTLNVEGVRVSASLRKRLGTAAVRAMLRCGEPVRTPQPWMARLVAERLLMPCLVAGPPHSRIGLYMDGNVARALPLPDRLNQCAPRQAFSHERREPPAVDLSQRVTWLGVEAREVRVPAGPVAKKVLRAALLRTRPVRHEGCLTVEVLGHRFWLTEAAPGEWVATAHRPRAVTEEEQDAATYLRSMGWVAVRPIDQEAPARMSGFTVEEEV